jgi:hypothetical protein
LGPLLDRLNGLRNEDAEGTDNEATEEAKVVRHERVGEQEVDHLRASLCSRAAF